MYAIRSYYAIFFLGVWHGPLLPPVVWFALKVLAVNFLFIWVRGSLPRFRYDQLMNLGSYNFV